MVDEPIPARLGRFAVLRRLGAGGMGVVYAAYDERLDRRVAIKLLHADRAMGTDGRNRLMREAQAMARLSHPHVVHVYEVGEHDDHIYVVMEFIEGQDLRHWGKTARPWAEVLDAYVQAGRGLAAAHEAGLVHRDFKPGNVMITDAGVVKVLDFGLARSVEMSAEDHRASLGELDHGDLDALTRPGTIMGTPGYMAPEVLRGRTADARSDQFSFCVSLFEAVYGERAFGPANSLASLLSVVRGEIPERPEAEVPAWLYRVVVRGLQPERRRRHPSMDALLAQLERHLSPPVAGRWLLATGGVAAAAVGATWFATQAEPPCPRDPDVLAQVWGPKQRAQLHTTFDSVVGSADIAVLATLERELDAYAERWRAMHHDACLATRVRGEQSEQLLDLRMACLQRHRRRLGTLARVLTSADPSLVMSAHLTAQALPEIDRCADTAALQDGVEPPAADEQAAVSAVRDRVFESRALRLAGHYSAALELATEAQQAAQSLTYAPLKVEADFAVAKSLDKLDHHDQAGPAMRAVYFDAIAIDRRDVAIDAAMGLAYIESNQAQHDRSVDWLDHAQALLDGLPSDDPTREARLQLMRASSSYRRGDYDEARAHYEQVRLYAEAHASPDSPWLATPLSGLSQVAMRQGRWSEATAFAQMALEHDQRVYGTEHPNVIQEKANLGHILLKSGAVDDAGVVLAEVLEKLDDSEHVSKERVASVLNNVGGVYERLDDTELARKYFYRAHALYLEALGPRHPLVAHPLNNLGNSFMDDERIELARDHYQQALEILEAAHGPKHMHVSFPLVGLGRVARARQQWSVAAEYFDRVVQIRRAGGAAPESVAESRFDRAIALWNLEPRRDEALALARGALAELQAAPEGSEDLDRLVADVRTWLDQHAEPEPGPKEPRAASASASAGR